MNVTADMASHSGNEGKYFEQTGNSRQIPFGQAAVQGQATLRIWKINQALDLAEMCCQYSSRKRRMPIVRLLHSDEMKPAEAISPPLLYRPRDGAKCVLSAQQTIRNWCHCHLMCQLTLSLTESDSAPLENSHSTMTIISFR